MAPGRDVVTEDPPVEVVSDLLAVAHRLMETAEPGQIDEQVAALGAELVTGATVELESLSPNGAIRLLAASGQADSAPIPTPPTAGPVILGRHRPPSHRISGRPTVTPDDGVAGSHMPLPGFEFVLGTDGQFQKRLRFQFADGNCPTPAARTLAAAYAAYAGMVLDRSSLVQEVEHLRAALQTNREIGAAVGIVMARHHVTYERAFDRLRKASQRANRRLGDIAAEVVHRGDLPVSDREERTG